MKFVPQLFMFRFQKHHLQIWRTALSPSPLAVLTHLGICPMKFHTTRRVSADPPKRELSSPAISDDPVNDLGTKAVSANANIEANMVLLRNEGFTKEQSEALVVLISEAIQEG